MKFGFYKSVCNQCTSGRYQIAKSKLAPSSIIKLFIFINSDAILNLKLIAMHCGLLRVISSFQTAVNNQMEKTDTEFLRL